MIKHYLYSVAAMALVFTTVLPRSPSGIALDIALNPVVHAAAMLTGAFQGQHGTYKYWESLTDKSRVAQLGVGAWNGLITAASVGYYWHRYPLPNNSKTLWSIPLRIVYYGLVPGAAVFNAFYYLIPPCGNYMHCEGKERKLCHMSIGTFSTASIVAFAAYGSRAISPWLTGSISALCVCYLGATK